MPGPGNSRIPTLSTMPEIGRFCNPTTATSTAVICNDLLQSVIMKLLEDAKAKALEDGKKQARKEELENKKEEEKRAYQMVGEKATKLDSTKGRKNRR